MNNKMSFLNIIIIIILIYLIATVVVYLFQRKLLYYPFSHNVTGNGMIHDFDEIKVTTRDNIDLKGWFHLKNINRKTLLIFHGNASNLDNRIDKLNSLGKLDINFLIISWRGYSGNKGSPSEKGLYEDAKSTLKWLNKKGIQNHQIILYGESLGTSIAIEIGQNKNFAGIILESPFTSMIDMGKKFYPIFPIKLLLKDKYNSKNKIKNIKFPILIMHGQKDELVPFKMGKEIYNLANEPKSKYFPENDSHMMNFDDKLIQEIDLFISTLN
tara:strand:+ start:88 stop:897 length:810 start_codon:yes stop_codon:yes gene_type:complete